ncbi:UNVERIFIED_CONTAM: hypothetical protein K2H54_033934 [Gekko kuhli]
MGEGEVAAISGAVNGEVSSSGTDNDITSVCVGTGSGPYFSVLDCSLDSSPENSTLHWNHVQQTASNAICVASLTRVTSLAVVPINFPCYTIELAYDLDTDDIPSNKQLLNQQSKEVSSIRNFGSLNAVPNLSAAILTVLCLLLVK